MRSGKHRGQKKQKRKGAYDKSGGITHDTAAFAFRTKDILKIRSRPRLETGSDYHYLMPAAGLEPARGCPQQILSLHRLPFRHAGLSTMLEYHDFKKNASIFSTTVKKEQGRPHRDCSASLPCLSEFFPGIRNKKQE